MPATGEHAGGGGPGLKPPTPGDLTVRAHLMASHLPGPVYCEEDYGPFVGFLNQVPKVPAMRPRPAADSWLQPWDDVRDRALLWELFEKER